MKSLGRFPDSFLAEIAGQPDALRRAAHGLADQRPAFERLAQARPARTRIVFTGMGSSYFAAHAAVTALAGAGVLAVMSDAAEILHFRLPAIGPGCVVVVVSQSGRSAEVVALARTLTEGPQRAAPWLVSVTNGLANPLAELVGPAGLRFDTGAGIETGPSTMTFGATLVVLAAVANVLGGSEVDTAISTAAEAAEAAADAAERLLADPIADAAALISWLGGRAELVILGRGTARPAAEMGALTLKEAARFPAESLQSAQFRHGPLELVGPDLAVIIVATEPGTRHLDLSLASDVRAAGAAVMVVSAEGEAPDGTLPVAIGELDPLVASAAAIIPIQLLSWRLAVDRNLQPGTYLRASKVTTRE